MNQQYYSETLYPAEFYAWDETEKERQTVAGRCIASEGDSWEVTRVIPAAAVTGEAAGVAASLSCKHRVLPSGLPIRTLQKALSGNGIPLHLDEVGLKYK